IQRQGSFEGEVSAGRPFSLDVSVLDPDQIPSGLPGNANDLAWSADGQYVVLSSEQSVLVADANSGRMVASGLGTLGYGVFDTGRDLVLYVARDPQSAVIEQVFSATQRGTEITQLTAHTECTVSDLIWNAD